MNIREEFRKPEWVSDWKIFLLFSFISFAIAFGMRAVELPKWDNPAFMVNGEYIMGTHDAYYWLAGAKGVGSAVDNPMSGMIRFLGTVTGAQYGNIAFWLPAVFAGFTAIAAFAWGMLVGGPWVGLVAAFYASSVPAYLFRTRLSYYDTDIVTLFFPLLISVLLARWLTLGSKQSWNFRSRVSIEFKPRVWDYLLPITAGVVTFNGSLWHTDINSFGLVAFGVSLLLIWACGTSSTRSILLRGVLLFSFVAFSGWLGLVLALFLVVVFYSKWAENYSCFHNSYVFLVLCVLTVVSCGVGTDSLPILLNKISAYMKPVVDVSKSTSGPLYPGITQSVIEAQNLGLDILFSSFIGNAFLGWAGFIFFAVALYFRPALLFIVPFAVMTFAAVSIGGRFAMFGGIPVGLGLSFVAKLLIDRFAGAARVGELLSVAQCLVFCAMLVFSSSALIFGMEATPIMSAQHVKALIESGQKMDKSGTVWTWWDWGYATMYYAGVHSFANGGHHSGKVLFPLGFAYATPNYMQSRQMIKFSAFNDNNPSNAWTKMGAENSEKMINSFGCVKHKIPEKNKQYIVVSWSDLRLAYWVLYYGSWSLKNGGGYHPSVSGIRNTFNINFAQGVIDIKNEGSFKLSSYEFMSPQQLEQRSYPNNVGPHLVYNKAVNQGFLVDDFTYSSVLFKLLASNPDEPELAEKFKLVYEGFPMVRVYEVL